MSQLPRIPSFCRLAALASLAALALMPAPPGASAAVSVPPGFTADVVVSDLNRPTALEFGPDGEVFVAERNGRIVVLDGIADEVPTVFADISVKVHGTADRGLLGLALDPDYPTRPFVYAAYTYDAPVGGTAPVHGGAGDADSCPSNPDGDKTCMVSGRLSRFELDPATGRAVTDPQGAPAERVLIEDWCQQYLSHSIGDIEFRPGTRELYMSAGEGASYDAADIGQLGSPANPCGDPPGEGGSLRSLDVVTPAGPEDPTGYGGTVLRIDPDTGAPVADNPPSGDDAAARRILAYGLRNPFRIEFRPGSEDLYVQDTGSSAWEEINRIPGHSERLNFGWPCYEGPFRQWAFDALDTGICEDIYAARPADLRDPYYRYGRSTLFPGDVCNPAPGAASTGMAFYEGTHYPSAYQGALFMANSPRGCIWVIRRGANGLPDPSTVANFATSSPAYSFVPVDVVEGPDGALYVPNYYAGEIVRIGYPPDNAPPVARLTASPTFGDVPLAVTFDASGSADRDGDPLAYEWDLDGDGQFDDASGTDPAASRTYADGSANVLVRVRVSDSYGSDVERVRLYPGNRPPAVPRIEQPTDALRWAVGETVTFAGSGTDPDQGDLPGSSLHWSVTMEHCPQECHTHPLFDRSGSAGTFAGPNHQYPSHLTLRLTATDARGMSSGAPPLRLDPRTIQVTLDSDPPGVTLTHNSRTEPAPFTVEAIAGASANLIAPAEATIGGQRHNFSGWSDGGARIHTITPMDSATYTAVYSGPDLTAPDTAIGSGPFGPANVTAASFTFSATEAGTTFQCSLDTGTPSWGSCTSPYTSPALPDGASRVFRVRAIDGAGNVDQTPATRAFVVDRTPPDTGIGAGPSGATSLVSPTFEFAASEPAARYECALAAGAPDWHVCTSPYSLTPLPHGASVTFRARAVDLAGNVDPTPAARSFTVDTEAPQTTITSRPKGTLADSAPIFTFVSSESGERFECSVDAGIASFAPCSGPGKTHRPAPLDDGAWFFRVRAVDEAGNADATAAEEAFSVLAPPALLPPAPVALRFASRPGGLPLRLGSELSTAPFSRSLPPGTRIRLAAPRRTKRGGRLLRFERWSSGAARAHFLTVSGPRRIVAFYAP